MSKIFCKGITKRGEPCTVTVLLADSFCVYHSPEYRASLLRQTKAAAKMPRSAITLKQQPVKSSADLFEMAGDLLTDIRTGKVKMSGKQAIAATTALGKLFMDAEKRSGLKQLFEEQAK